MGELAAGQDQVIAVRRGWVESLWVELRPRQWVKNLFVLAPLLFSQNLLWYPLIGRARIREFRRTSWGELWESYRQPQPLFQPAPVPAVN